MRERQLELGLANGRPCPSVNLRGRRHRRRHEWFERMRQVVENATDRQQFEDQTQEPHTDH
jgi:hypothetical protein